MTELGTSAQTPRDVIQFLDRPDALRQQLSAEFVELMCSMFE